MTIQQSELSPVKNQKSIEDKIMECFPSGAYALSALLRLLDIVETREVPTAAVECKIQPLLKVNPDFVAKHAQTPEKLLMLVMHELHHVLLGHTTLFPTVTPVQNFVFDTVINGLICRMFPEAEYTALLTGIYAAERFPECLLRPPQGWPNRFTISKGISDLPDTIRARALEIHRALYSDCGATYQEVFDILPKFVSDDDVIKIVLLGGHAKGGATEGNFEGRSPLLFDVVRGIVEQWPQPPDPIKGRSLADLINQELIKPKAPSNRAVLRELFRKVAGFGKGENIRRRDTGYLPISTPIPVLDRRSIVMRSLGQEPLLHQGSIAFRRSVRVGQKVHVYLDVSGSMNGVKEALYGAILDCKELVHPQVHLFSTQIADISMNDLKRGICRSTGGTDIVCVAESMEANKVRRALIVTDGFVGQPQGQHFSTLARAKLAVAYLGLNTNMNDLAKVTDFSKHIQVGV